MECRNIFEVMPFYSNVPPHILQMELFKPYSARRFSEIASMSPIHKLTHYGDKSFNPDLPETMYQHILTATTLRNWVRPGDEGDEARDTT